MRTSIFRLGLLIAALTLVLPAPVFAAESRPDFSGSWKLNEELSDDAREKVREAAKARRGGGGRRRGGGSGGGMRSRWRRMQEMRNRLEQMEQGIQSMNITQTATTLTIVNANDREQKIITDGSTHSREGRSGTVESETHWRKRSLEIVDRPEEGPKVIRTYFFRRDDPHLYVMTEVEGRGPKFEYQRVYDRVAPGTDSEPELESAGGD